MVPLLADLYQSSIMGPDLYAVLLLQLNNDSISMTVIFSTKPVFGR